MMEKINQIPAKLLEFWNKYTSKQKTLIISSTAVVYLVLVGAVYFVSRPQMEVLIEAGST